MASEGTLLSIVDTGDIWNLILIIILALFSEGLHYKAERNLTCVLHSLVLGRIYSGATHKTRPTLSLINSNIRH